MQTGEWENKKKLKKSEGGVCKLLAQNSIEQVLISYPYLTLQFWEIWVRD